MRPVAGGPRRSGLRIRPGAWWAPGDTLSAGRLEGCRPADPRGAEPESRDRGPPSRVRPSRREARRVPSSGCDGEPQAASCAQPNGQDNPRAPPSKPSRTASRQPCEDVTRYLMALVLLCLRIRAGQASTRACARRRGDWVGRRDGRDRQGAKSTLCLAWQMRVAHEYRMASLHPPRTLRKPGDDRQLLIISGA
ncbi:unnamed protein product [Diplocarpon coronariae]